MTFQTRFRQIMILLIIVITCGVIPRAAIPDIKLFEKNMKNRGDQTALRGTIDSMVVIRPGAEFHLGHGKVTLFDFGASRPCAMVFEGDGRFIFNPPNSVEENQLEKFTDKKNLNEVIKSAVFIFTEDLKSFPDTTTMTRDKIEKSSWNLLSRTVDDAFDRMDVYLPNRIIGDLLTDFPGFYLYVDFELEKTGRFAFVDDPVMDDQYCLRKRVNYLGINIFEYVCGYSTRA